MAQHKVKQQPRQNPPHHNWYPNMTWSLRVEYATSHVCHYALRRWRGCCYESAQPVAATAFTDIALTSAPPSPMCRFGGGGKIQPYVFFSHLRWRRVLYQYSAYHQVLSSSSPRHFKVNKWRGVIRVATARRIWGPTSLCSLMSPTRDGRREEPYCT